jgi:hypothetical protein
MLRRWNILEPDLPERCRHGDHGWGRFRRAQCNDGYRSYRGYAEHRHQSNKQLAHCDRPHTKAGMLRRRDVPV